MRLILECSRNGRRDGRLPGRLNGRLLGRKGEDRDIGLAGQQLPDEPAARRLAPSTVPLLVASPRAISKEKGRISPRCSMRNSPSPPSRPTRMRGAPPVVSISEPSPETSTEPVALAPTPTRSVSYPPGRDPSPSTKSEVSTRSEVPPLTASVPSEGVAGSSVDPTSTVPAEPSSAPAIVTEAPWSRTTVPSAPALAA